jgi:hypothetical protein
MAGALVGDVAVVLPVTLGRHLDGDRASSRARSGTRRHLGKGRTGWPTDVAQ